MIIKVYYLSILQLKMEEEEEIVDEEPYDRNEKRRVVEELEVVFELARLSRKCSSGHVRNMFFLIEQMSYVDLLSLSEDQYLTDQSSY